MQSLNLSKIINESQKEIFDLCVSNDIEVHHSRSNIEDGLIDYLSLFVYFERRRRGDNSYDLPLLEEIEKKYYGIEVGNIRRYLNKFLLHELKDSKDLLDYGCGGTWWKDFYWNKMNSVAGVEIDPFALIKLREHFTDTRRFRLIYTTTGITEIPDESFDTIISSSVIGYILPTQSDAHLKECRRLLKPGGKLIITRVNMFGTQNFFRGRLRENKDAPGTFEYAYTKKELLKIIKQNFAQDEIIKYSKIGFYPAFIPIRQLQKLYKHNLFQVISGMLVKLFPFWGIHHHVVIKKNKNNR